MRESNVSYSDQKNKNHKRIIRMARITIGSALITICAWIAIPFPVTQISFTLQTLAVFCLAGLLGKKDGTLSVLLYLVFGAMGLPVFSGFANLYVLLGSATAGYALGFLPMAWITGWVTEFTKHHWWGMALGMTIGLLVGCYAFGALWFYIRYIILGNSVSIWTVLWLCVIPYLPVDVCKIVLATLLTDRLYRFIFAKKKIKISKKLLAQMRQQPCIYGAIVRLV